MTISVEFVEVVGRVDWKSIITSAIRSNSV